MEGSLASLATTLHDKFGITVKTVAFDSYKMMSKALSKESIDVALRYTEITGLPSKQALCSRYRWEPYPSPLSTPAAT